MSQLWTSGRYTKFTHANKLGLTRGVFARSKDGTQRLLLKTSAGCAEYNSGVKAQKLSGQVSTHTYRWWKRRLFLEHWESAVSSIIRKNKIKQPLYLCGWTLKAIKSSCHNINRCGTVENVKIKQVGSVSKNTRQKKRASLIL